MRGHLANRYLRSVVVACILVGGCAAPPADSEGESVTQALETKKVTDGLPPNMQGGNTTLPIENPIGDGVRMTWDAPDPSKGEISGIKLEADVGLFWKTICDGGTLTLTADGLSFDCNWKFPASNFVSGKIEMKGEWVFPHKDNSDGYIVVRPRDEKGRVFPPIIITVVKRKSGMVVKVYKADLDGDKLRGIGDKVGEISVGTAAPGLSVIPTDAGTAVALVAISAAPAPPGPSPSIEVADPTVDVVVVHITTIDGGAGGL